VGERVIVLRGYSETVKQDVGRPVGYVVAIPVGNKVEPRRTQKPDAAKAELDAGESLNFVSENRALVKPSIAVDVLENQQAVAQPQVKLPGCLGVSVVFGDPEASPVIPCHRDRVLDVWLGSEDGGPESRGNPEARCRGRSRQRARGGRLGIARRGEIPARGGERNDRRERQDTRAGCERAVHARRESRSRD